MKFNLDTDNFENIKITFTDEEYELEVPDLIEEFCFAMSSLYLDFALKLDCNTEKAKGLKEILLDCTERNIDMLLDKGILENLKSEDREELEEELEELSENLAEADFTEEEIDYIVELARTLGSVEAVNDYLKEIADEAGLISKRQK